MAEFIHPQIDSDPTTIEDEIYTYIQSVFPDWEPREPHLAVLITEALAQQIDELKTLASDVPPSIFRSFGRLVGVVPQEATAASGATTWTMRDDAGYTIPAGTGLRIPTGGGEFAFFETVGDVVVPAGQTATAAGEVIIQALELGAESSGLSAGLELLDVLDYVTNVVLVSPTSGGQDAEEDDDYLDKLAERLQLMADRPILARDFEIYVNTIIGGVHRTLVLDNYNPVDDTFNNEKMITVVAIDENGNAVSQPVKDEIVAQLEEVRELNFQVNTMDPQYTAVTIDVTVMAYPGYDPPDVDSRVVDAVVDYLNPASWGIPQNISGGGGQDRRWVNETKVRYLEISTIVNNVIGVNYIESLTINAVADDLTMTGRAALPADNPTVNVTVNAPA